MQDARTALKWVFDHSLELGIDPERIVVSGGSAGGHLAACTAILREAPFDTQEIWKIPKAMVLFNPVVDTTESGWGSEIIGEKAKELSPVHHIVPGLPPTIVFHGTADNTVPFGNTKDFCSQMVRNGNKCELISYEGEGHAFLNIKKGKGTCFWDTIRKAEDFLRKYGYM